MRRALASSPVRACVDGGRRGYRLVAGEFGTGGRSSVSGMNVALFGATGFLGRYVTNELGQVGSTCYIANRGCEMETRHLKPMFDLGNAAFHFYSPRDEDSIREVIEGADIVINMIGKSYETKHAVPTGPDGKLKLWGGSRVNYGYEEVNVTIPATLAKISKEMGCSKFVHVSALAASADSASEWARTKAAGELAVRAEFEGATVIRPAPTYGHEDKFLNLFAFMAERLPFLPMLEDGAALVQPVYVADVASAIVKTLEDTTRDYSGATLELAGPAEYSRKELLEFTLDITKQSTSIMPIPQFAMAIAGEIANQIPEPYLTPDDCKLWLEDIVLAPKEGVLTFEDLDMQDSLTPIEKVAFQYLHRYRKGGHFVLQQGYH